jgi:hypothetical protein
MGWLSNAYCPNGKGKAQHKESWIFYGTNIATHKNNSGVSNDTVVNSLQFAPKVNPNLLFEKSLCGFEFVGLS